MHYTEATADAPAGAAVEDGLLPVPVPVPARGACRPRPPGPGEARWGRYAPAVARWERALGRAAPAATDARGRLSAAFVEWMMGLAPGWITAVPGLTRAAQLKALGNGVVPAGRRRGPAAPRARAPALTPDGVMRHEGPCRITSPL
ncbi:hypothetical protein LUR56_39820 [Streptomyces sp. MT29]|nr:hypothetical protein [Streptomyces sp. MT29]